MAPAQIVHEAQSMSALWLAPFALLLAAIAVMPFINKHWWEKYYPAVSLGLAALAAGGYCLILARPEKWLAGMMDYVSFVILLGSLLSSAEEFPFTSVAALRRWQIA